ncbi:SGNH/GDSL hydrolase family protein [Nocardioides sp. W3-2-3]|uniref:SGNH/GDSL hydrolase family protein n=1 Tax=Nocardioides convexus TaxID=2712224 RepID=UPI002418AA24|nr:SGNH/GDSL hydrolase family protein [Nocardioides convexus]NHA00189.1 SGNH/GDSL hydrolase family protein [Nocardioides convexus]
MYGGGGLSALGAGLYGVLTAEARLARKTIGPAREEPPPDATGWYGRGRPGPALRIALLGDSSAAGYGVDRVEETPGALIASALAEHANRRVYLREFCVVGAKSSDLAAQVDRALPIEPEVVVILIGGNDVTHTMRPSQSVRYLSDGVRRLMASGAKVVVGTCPDLGTVQPIAPPLRQVARAWSRRLAAAQTIAVIEEGGRTVSLGDVLGPEFAAAPALLFGPDQFHPSVVGYRKAGRRPGPLGARRARAGPRRRSRPGGLPRRGRPAHHPRRGPGRQRAGHRNSTAPRSAAAGPAYEACGWSLRHRRSRQHVPGEAPDEHEMREIGDSE